MGRLSHLISTATSSVTRRKTENQKQGWEPSPLCVDDGKSRVSARERPEGCIAKAVALAPWCGDGESREG